jgi:hypothetical protein
LETFFLSPEFQTFKDYFSQGSARSAALIENNGGILISREGECNFTKRLAVTGSIVWPRVARSWAIWSPAETALTA